MREHSTPCTPAQFWQTLALAARFWARVDFSGECWLWTGCVNHGGYGVGVDLDGKPRLAHRIAYFLGTGEDPEGSLVCHRCDNRRCCRPDHLFLGDHLVNNRDMMAKGRASPGTERYAAIRADHKPRGEHHGSAKLTEQQVAEIRRRYATMLVTQQTLADEFGVSRRHIGHIIKGTIWRHLK